MSNFSDLTWEEKYRPPSLFQSGKLCAILPESFEGLVKIAKGERPMPNLLLHSSESGTGKTTILHALANDLGMEHIYFNISECGGIDTIRDVLMGYSETRSRNKKMKLIQLDEADGASQAFQKAMRGLMESAIDNVRFVITCNYPDSIINAIHSRCEAYDLSYVADKDTMMPKITSRLMGILKKEAIEFEPEAVGKLVEKLYPDMRRMMKATQRIAESNGKFDMIAVDQHEDDSIDGITNAIMALNIKDAMQWYREKGIDPNRLYRPLFKSMPYLVHISLRAETMYLIEEYVDRASRSIDREITFFTLIVKLVDMAKTSRSIK